MARDYFEDNDERANSGVKSGFLCIEEALMIPGESEHGVLKRCGG